MLSDVLDRVIAYAAKDTAELAAAQKLWSEAAGRIYDDDSLYEERAAAFLEWYALERPSADGRTPAQRYLALQRLEDLDGRWLHALDTSHRSLFEIVAIDTETRGTIELADLLTGCRFTVTERRTMPGLAARDLFEARLIADVVSPPELLFGKAMCFHPPIAAAAIRELCATARADGERPSDVLFRLARLRVRALRWAHVSADRIYAQQDAAWQTDPPPHE